jgi:hypothetical protein
MAYARWGDTDIYFFWATFGGLVCMSCVLMPDTGGGWHEDFHCKTGAEGLAHLRAHEAAGHETGDAITGLERDIEAGETFGAMERIT